jgi:hypothetical protein
VVVVSRARCRLHVFEMPEVPPAERLAAARLLARGWNAFEDATTHIAIAGGRGLLVAWDRAAAAEQLRSVGAIPERLKLVPEIFHRLPGADGLRLAELAEGYEGQAWRAGFLVASRWWGHQPTEADWLLFSRSTGLGEGAQAPLPQAQAVPWVRTPWARASSMVAEERLGRVESVAVAAGVFAIAAGLTHVGVRAWEAATQGDALRAEVSALQQAKEPSLALRDRVFKQADEVTTLARWMEGVQPTEVLAHVEGLLRKSAVLLREFDVQGRSVRLALELGSQATRTAVLRELQSGGWLTSVAEMADSQRGLMVVEARLASPLPPAPADPARK